MIVMPFVANALDVNAKIITDSYLQGALQEKQDKLTPDSILFEGDEGDDVFITNISADNGVLTVTRGRIPSVNVEFQNPELNEENAPIITNITMDEESGTMTVTRGSVKIPVGGEEATEGLASIWIQ